MNMIEVRLYGDSGHWRLRQINAINSLNLNSLHGNTLTYLFFSLLAGFLAASNC